MSSSVERATVVGDGAMGTLCALMLARRGVEVVLWGRSPEHVETLRRDRQNKRYLAGHPFPDSLSVTSDAQVAFDGAQLVVSAVPCQYLRRVWRGIGPIASAPRVGRSVASDPRVGRPKTVVAIPAVPIVSVSKGIEVGTLLRPTQIIAEFAPSSPSCCLSGPNIASEIAAAKPAGAVAAADDETIAVIVQQAFSTPEYRVYTNTDLLGVELAGATKNVIAIAAGICDGIEGGCNAKASLVTRGLVEITRLGVALGARAETFQGLAGVGDLITTSISPVGRNRSAGEKIGRGMPAQAVIDSTPSVIEGIPTTRSVLQLAADNEVEMPITQAVGEVLFDGKSPSEAIHQLMTRQLRSE